VRTDSNGNVYESNEANNVQATPITITAPDLTPTALVGPSSATPQQLIEVWWTVQNQGAGIAWPSWYDQIYLSTDVVWDNSDTALTYATRPFAVEPDGSYTLTVAATIPNVSAGSYYLLVRTDVNGNVYESNEANNVRPMPILIVIPDLTPTALVAASEAAPQQQVEMSWTVKNQGAGSALPSWSDNLYLSTDNVWDGQDTPLGYWTRNEALAAGASYTQTQRITLPNVQVGSFYLILRTDGGGNLYESNEANNEIRQSIQIRITDAVGHDG
jgi:subtilase family serine protease